MEERKAKGDTVSMPYAELQKLLPTNISGYAKEGEPKGESINMVGMSYSTASQVYKNGDAEITVNIMDYNASYAAFGAATAMFATGFSVDNDEEHLGAVDLGINGVKACYYHIGIAHYSDYYTTPYCQQTERESTRNWECNRSTRPFYSPTRTRPTRGC